MSSSLLLWLQLALAGLPEELAVASDKDLPQEVRQKAFEQLVVIGSEEGQLEALYRICLDQGRSVPERWVATRALGLVQTLEARQLLAELMNSQDVWVRLAAVTAAGERGDIALSGRVAARLTDKAILVRGAAAESLGKLKDPATIGDLERALQDPSNWYRGTSLWVRRKFVEALANIGKESAPVLARTLDDKDPEVAATALKALEYIAGFSFKEGRTPAEEKEAWKRWAGA
jgi:HEAT repeat protein